MKTSIHRLLLLFTALTTLTLAGLGGVSYNRASNLMGNLDNVTAVQLPAVRAMTLVDMMHDGLRAVAMDALYTAQIDDQGRFGELRKESQEKTGDMKKHLDSLRALSLPAETQAAIEVTLPKVEAYTASATRIIELALSLKINDATALLPQFHQAFSELEDSLEKLGELIESDALKTRDEGKDALALSGTITVAGVILGLLLSMFIIRRITSMLGEVSGRLSQSGRFVSATSSELAAAGDGLSTTSTQTASALQQTVASLEELSSMVKTNSEHAQVASQMAHQSEEAADRGNREIGQLTSAMNEISESSRKISEIIDVVDDIAFQTNLLALNAAVEAARAGEQGRGFAVVADAVRALAQRSANAAREISTLIRDSVSKVDNGKQIAHRGSAAFQEIRGAISKMAQLNGEIASGSHQQASGLMQINKALTDLDSSTQRNAATAEQMAATTKEMSQQATGLETLVVDLNRIISGRANPQTERTKAA